MRLARYLAMCGLASRREAERMIDAGRVCVNGEIVTTPACNIVPGEDRVELDGREAVPVKNVYVLLNKPAGCVCTRTDPQDRTTIYSLLPPEHSHLAYVGRLDYNTEGTLLFTNDGQLNYRLTRPEFGVEKVYEAKVKGSFPAGRLVELEHGVEVDGERLRAHRAVVTRELRTNTLVEIVLTEGKNREVRRMLTHLGLYVVRLRRVAFAGLRVGRLQPGKWRELTAAEVRQLHSLVGLDGDS